MSENLENRKETLMAAMWLETTALTKEVAEGCRASIPSLRKGLSKTQVDECRREVARRAASKTGSPVLVFQNDCGGTMRMDLDAARSVVGRGTGHPRAERDLVVLLAAFCLLALVHDQLTSRASQVYYGALKNEVATQVRSGPMGQHWVARIKAASLLGGNAEAQARDDFARALTAATKALDDSVMMEFVVRKAACMGIHLGGDGQAAANRN
jgi:hypothetical protein